MNHQKKCRGNFGSERIHRGTEFGRVRPSCRHAGNLTSDGLRIFEYDSQNRHSKTVVNDPDEGSKISYLHNALGQRVFKSEPKVDHVAPNATVLGTPFITWLQSNFGWLFAQAQLDATLGQSYVYDDGQLGATPTLLGEYGNGGSNSLGRYEYIWLPTESGQPIPIGQHRTTILSATHTDHLGTPRKITGTDNNTAWQWPYSAFGENAPTGILTATSNPELALTRDAPTDTKLATSNPLLVYNLRFPGQYFDSESNLNFNYFRSYQAGQGRYTQADPIGLSGGWNRFTYVEGNPLSNVDPEGLRGGAGGARSSNARDAAGFHDPRGDFVCEQWNCPANSGACSRDDLKRPTDFIPAATSPAAAPDGCKCTRLGYRRDWNPPTPEERELAEAYANYKDAQSMTSRFRNARGNLPLWHRIGGYGK